MPFPCSVRTLTAVVCAWVAALLQLRADDDAYEQPPINYSKAQPHDIITRLESRLASGELKLAGTDKEIAAALLRELHIPIESQIVVFSKTSFQRAHIRPDHPRAIYFSDSCYVGWVPGGLMEVASIDPTLGPIFYSFDPQNLKTSTKTHFERDNDCLRCHGGNFVSGIPGVFARSVYCDDTGEALLRHGSEVVDYHTPFDERWGGWYVTGKHGKALHRGNVLAHEKDNQLVFDPKRGANVTDLSRYFDTSDYLTRSSDIIALMVMEHQTAMHNAITRAGFNCRRMLDYQKKLQHDLKEPITDEPSYDSVKSVFESSTRDVLDTLLFKDEAPLPDGLEGSVAFQKAFLTSAPKTKAGTSLKDFSLKEHLFKNRCSYLIYSEAFLNLPEVLKRRVYQRLAAVLRANESDSRYSYLGEAERQRILAILRETHPEFAKAAQTK